MATAGKRLANKYQYNDLLIRSKDPYAQAKYEVILGWLKEAGVKTVLNAGCGSGELSMLLAEHGYQVIGFDLDHDYIKLAKKNAKKLKINNCAFAVADIETYKTKRTFDAVVATDVLEHIKNDKIAFLKLASFVRPGGSVMITVPAGPYLFGFHDEKLGHFRRYSISGFQTIIPRQLRLQKIRYFGFLLIPVAFFVSKVFRTGYHVDESGQKKNRYPIGGELLKVVFAVEKSFSFPLGTSLLFWGIKN